jgi:hypothetical protein
VVHWAARRDAALALLATCSERLHTAKNVRLFYFNGLICIYERVGLYMYI